MREAVFFFLYPEREKARGWTHSYWKVNDGSGTAKNAGKRKKGRQTRRSSQLLQFSELRKEQEMHGNSTRMHLDLTWRQDNVNWIVWEQNAAYFPAGRRRTTMMIENRSHLFVVGIMMGHSLVKSHTFAGAWRRFDKQQSRQMSWAVPNT